VTKAGADAEAVVGADSIDNDEFPVHIDHGNEHDVNDAVVEATPAAGGGADAGYTTTYDDIDVDAGMDVFNDDF
jgi:hypothetical protein